MKKGDIFILVLTVIVALSVLAYFKLGNKNDTNAVLEIISDKQVIKTIDLENTQDQEFTIETDYGWNTIKIENGTAMVTDADCHDLVCVHSKEVDSFGESIICLPHKLILRVISGEDSEVDTVAQ